MATVRDFQALLVDVDKTLTNDAGEITSATRVALEKVQSLGIHVGVCTGRTLALIQETVLTLFPATALHVMCGGTQVSTSLGEIRWERNIPAETVQKLTEMFFHEGLPFLLNQGNQLFVTPTFVEKLRTYFNFSQIRYQILTGPVAETATFLSVLNLSPTLQMRLQEFPGITAKVMPRLNGTQFYADITVAGVTKATGFHEWCQLLHLQPEQVIGVGDSENDLEFLKAVGWPVAMGNATNGVKQIARRVIGRANDDGLAQYLLALVDGQEV